MVLVYKCAMAYIDQIDPDDATGELKRQFDAAIRRAGRIYNIIRIMSQTPQILGDSMRFYLNLMRSGEPLAGWRCELLATVVSRINHCVY